MFSLTVEKDAEWIFLKVWIDLITSSLVKVEVVIVDGTSLPQILNR